MIKGREKIIAQTSLIVQSVLTMACFVLAIWFTNSFIESIVFSTKEYKEIFLIIALLSYVIYAYFELGKMVRTKRYRTLFFEYLRAVFTFFMFFLLTFYFINIYISVWTFSAFLVFNILVLYFYKITIYRFMKYFRRSGRNIRSVLIFADKNSEYFIDQIIDSRDWGYRIYAICSSSNDIIKKYADHYSVISVPNHLSELIDEKTIDEVMYCMDDVNHDRIRNLICDCSEVGVTFRMHSELFRLEHLKSEIASFNEMPFISFSNLPSNYFAFQIKKLLGYITAAFIMICISPVFIVIAVLIKIDDGGPIFFKQVRVGQNGRLFSCLKFRTMVVNAEKLRANLMNKNEQKGPVFKIKNDPRVTKIGAFLRKTSLDELPQFINVLLGDMSIVGPRPPIPSEVEQYERWQRRRLSMKPGITCIWQVSGRNNIPFEQWMKLDMQYIDSWSLGLDISIFFKTIKVMITRDGQ